MRNEPVRTPQRERRARTRAGLIRAAGKVFADRGYHSATLDDVLSEAGVSRGALYHYFPSKQELFLALLRERMTAGLDVAGEVLEKSDTAGDAVVAAAAGFLGRVASNPRWLPLLLEFLAAGCRDESVRTGVVTQFLRPSREQTASLIRASGPPLADMAFSADELAVGVTAMINGLAIEQAFDPQAVPADLAGRLVSALIRGASAS